ncbi:MAG TPA: four-carbon acid sugar kinase family protein [Firmicutes bacterium]|nr:four-carbon acid sugar kinase family protein [Candidatus Fermentithermobacillaceae bacterium]
MERWAVVADDLTGAGDTGVQFVREGLKAKVCLTLEDIRNQGDYDVLVVNTDSRAMPGDRAQEVLRTVAGKLKEMGISSVYKKIDSTFRGNVAEEVDALVEGFGFDLALVAPSFPANGRTVVGGYLLVNGEPVSRTPIGQDPVTPVRESFLPALIAARSRRPVTHLPLSLVARGPQPVSDFLRGAAARGERTVIADAVSSADLENLVASAMSAGLKTMFVGSAGLAIPVARNLARAKGRRTSKFVLVVCGSVNPKSREQAEALLQQPGWAGVTVDPGVYMKEQDLWSAILGQTLDSIRNRDLQGIVLTTPAKAEEISRVKAEAIALGIQEKDVGRKVSEALAKAVSHVLRIFDVSGFVLTGGDTAASVISFLGSSGIELESEVSPGVPVGKLVGGPYDGRPVVTKAGGFGGKDVLCEAAKMLQNLK